MRAKCIAREPTENQVQELGEYYAKYGAKHDTHLTLGKSYLILGLAINIGDSRMAAGVSLTLLCDYGHIESYPIVLFDIVDGSVDPEWTMRRLPRGIIQIKPELLLQPHFAEDYAEGLSKVVRPFKELLVRMEQRMTAPSRPEAT